MQIVTVIVLVHDQEGDIRDRTEVHEVLELQWEEVTVQPFNDGLSSHDAKEDEGWEEELQNVVSWGELTWGRRHVRISLSKLFPA